MSSRTMARSSSNMNSASARASSVFPSPVGPRKVKEPIGLLLLLRPARGELVAARLRLGQLPLERRAHVLRFLAHRGELDLELADAPVGLVELDRRRVDLHPKARPGLVDQVDRLVGELAV